MNSENSNVDYNKKFSEYALVIYKFMIGFIDKYGIMTVDWMGYVLGLNKNSKPISKQSAEELSENFKNLAEELKKPEVRESIMLTIKETEPVLKEAFYSMLNVVMSAGEFVIKDGITFICSDTPAAPICGLFKFAQNTVDFGQDLLDGTRSGLHTIEEGKEAIQNVSNKLEESKEAMQNVSNAGKEAMQNVSNESPNFANAGKEAMQNVSNAGKEAVQNVSNTGKNFANMQSGGAKELKKYSKEKKMIETRVNKSIKDFLNLKSKKKTRKFYKNKY